MSRNVFEGNSELPISAEEAMQIGGKMHSMLPPAKDGHHYELKTLDSGRVVVIVEQD